VAFTRSSADDRRNPWVGVSVRLHISAKEALAALLALKRAPPEAQHCTVRVAIDAQAIVYAYRKRYSGSRILHDIITRCLAIAKSKGLRLQFVWIRGEDNASDIISRPDKWVGDSMANIDWTTPDAVLRLRRTVSRLGEEARLFPGVRRTPRRTSLRTSSSRKPTSTPRRCHSSTSLPKKAAESRAGARHPLASARSG
jgi:hypothetical protein